MEIHIGQTIAIRTLRVAGEKKNIKVRIGRPKRFPDGEDYFCPYQIIGMGNEKVRHAAGVDAVQALVLALERIGAELYTSDEAKAGKLAWLDDNEKNLGFPVPDTLRDLIPRSGGPPMGKT